MTDHHIPQDTNLQYLCRDRLKSHSSGGVSSKNSLYNVDNKRIMKLNSSANKEHFYFVDAGII